MVCKLSPRGNHRSQYNIAKPDDNRVAKIYNYPVVATDILLWYYVFMHNIYNNGHSQQNSMTTAHEYRNCIYKIYRALWFKS